MVEVKSLISDNRRAFFKINKLYGKKASGNKNCLVFFFHARVLLLYISDTFHYDENKIVHSYVMGGRLKKLFEFPTTLCIFTLHLLTFIIYHAVNFLFISKKNSVT